MLGRVCARIVTGLLFFGSWTLPSSFVASFVEPNKVLIGIIIGIDAKGAQALRAAPPASRDCLREECKTCGSLLAKHFPQGRARRPCAPPGNPS